MNVQKFNQDLKKVYQQKYGVAVFDIEMKNVKGGIEISGEVLIKSQKDDILNVFKKEKVKIKKVNLKVLSDASERNEIGWAIVKVKLVDLRSKFVSNKILNSRILKRIRCSQAFQSEVLRVLFKKDDQLLIQQNDLSLGWVNRSELILKKKNLNEKWMQQFYTPWYGTKNKILIAGADKNKIIKEAEKYLGAPYLLGGKTKKGIDCSGLTQMIYKNVFNIILPKHSWDQKEMGKKVNLKNIKTGDLMFLIKKSNKHKHIGIVEKNKTVNLIHASLEKKRVVRQKLDEVFEKYDFVEARKIAK
ncbi:C40 family peptidase [Candidatus Parcubacteria bacterium]|nr:C40 family peptidase [Candidatus Parcubacteria bacterium]